MLTWPNGWWIEVHDATKAITLGIKSGAGKEADQTWTNWHRGSANRIPLPDDQQRLDRIFVEVINPEEEHVEVDILYNGGIRQSFVFDNTHEWYEIERGG